MSKGEFENFLYQLGIKKIIYGKEMNCFSIEEMKGILNNIKQFERPDMYSTYGNIVAIFEYFQFDGSKKRNGHGMCGIEEENHINTEMQEFFHDNTTEKIQECVKSPNYKTSVNDYWENFRSTFENHYSKIDSYKENLRQHGILKDSSILRIGFLTECKEPPFIMQKQEIKTEKPRCINIINTKKFLDYFKTKNIIDFMMYMDDSNYIYYIDHNTISQYENYAINIDEWQSCNLSEFCYGSKVIYKDD